MTSLKSLHKNKCHNISNFKRYNMFENYFHKHVSKWKKKKKKAKIKAEERVGALHQTACLPVERMFSGS